MKSLWSLLLLTVIAAAGCSPTDTPSPDRAAGARVPDWDLARQQLSLSAEEILLGPTVQERGARASEGITVGDTISVRHEGWDYSWKVKPPHGGSLVLEKLEATRIQ